MISKIVQKEKARQDGLFDVIELMGDKSKDNLMRFHVVAVLPHKQTIFNLREHFQEQIENLKPSKSGIPILKYDIMVDQFEEDIQELTKMIEEYE